MTQLPSGLYGRLNFFICPCTIVRPIDSRRAPGVWPFAAFVSYCTRTILPSRWLIPMPAGINHACMRAPVPSPLHFGCFQLPAQNCTYSAGSIKIVRTYSTPVTWGQIFFSQFKRVVKGINNKETFPKSHEADVKGIRKSPNWQNKTKKRFQLS